MLRSSVSRRRLLLRLLQGAVLLPLGASTPRVTHASERQDVHFIARTLELARIGSERGDGTPYGAVVVSDGIVIAEGWNRAHLKRDATAHAEVEAIQAAARVLGSRNLAGCTLYTNGGRPCPMCEGAAYFANVDRLVYAHSVDAIMDAGRPQLGGC